MNESELLQASIGDLARAYRDRQLSPLEVTDFFLARIERLDPTLNAFRRVLPEQAMSAAHAATLQLGDGIDLGPLHGIPMVIKDLFDLEGQPTSAGTRLLETGPKASSAAVVTKLQRAGAIVLGKTNTVQFAYGGVGINHDHGTPHNPWHREPHVPGGSSSGTGVAIAAGLAVAGLGTDTGGSVRIPASLCGVTGLKTTVGQISRSGVHPLSWSLASVGPLTRNVEDAALLFQVMRGEDPDDPSTLNINRAAPTEPAEVHPRSLRLGVPQGVLFRDVDPQVAAAVDAAIDTFRAAGARIEMFDFPEADQARDMNPGGLVIAAEAYLLNKQLVDEHYDELDPAVRERMLAGRDIPAHEYLQTLNAWPALRRAATERIARYDALLCPATMRAALPTATIDASAETYATHNVEYLRNTSVGNLLDLCGLSIPCGATDQGLPIGLMVYAPAHREDSALRVGKVFQTLTDWHRHRPDLAWIET